MISIIYMIQTYDKIKFFLQHVWYNTKVGILLQILNDIVQTVSGIENTVLETEKEWTQWVEETQYPHIWRGLHDVWEEIKTIFNIYHLPKLFNIFLMNIHCIPTLLLQWGDKKVEHIPTIYVITQCFRYTIL